MEWASIDTEQRAASFIAQCAHESGEFQHLVENLNYSAQGLLGVFASHFTAAEVSSYARNPERIANRAYASRMGNGAEDSGDGWLYRGRGPFQLTGKDSYRACSIALFNDESLVDDPDSVIDPPNGAMSAAWFWRSHGLNGAADRNDQRGICRSINGGFNGLEERLAYYSKAIAILGG